MAHHDTQAQPTEQAAPPPRPGASWWVPERLEPGLVALGVGECQGCELHEPGHAGAGSRGLPATGPVPAPVVLVGTQPSMDLEDERPEDGDPARHALRQALEQAGLDPDTTWSTYVVKHAAPDRPPGAELDPAHVTACAPWWHAELEMVRPRWVVLLGDTAARAVLGHEHATRLVRGRPAAWPRELDRAVRRLDAPHHPDHVLLVGDPLDALDDHGHPRPADVAALAADLSPAARE